MDLVDLTGGFDDRLEFRDGASFDMKALLERIKVRSGRNGAFVTGTMSTADGSIEFKRWSVDGMDAGVYRVKGHYETYQGRPSAVVKSVDRVVADPDDYRFSPYGKNLDSKVHEFTSSLRPKAQKLFRILITGAGSADNTGSVDGAVNTSSASGASSARVPDLRARFKSEYAAVGHHDAYPHGLLAHSFKTALIARWIVSNPLYGELYRIDPDVKDLIVVGALLHDLGKTLEYNAGTISNVGRMVSHRTLMSERLALLREPIEDLYDEDAYWLLQSVFTQHHGRYEETPRTVVAYIVHMADSFDAQLTDLNELLKTPSDGQVFLRDDAGTMILMAPKMAPKTMSDDAVDNVDNVDNVNNVNNVNNDVSTDEDNHADRQDRRE